MNKKSHVITLRVSDSLSDKITQAVKLAGRDQADLLREALEIGLADLALIQFDPLSVAMEKIIELKSQASKTMSEATLAEYWLDLYGGVAAGDRISSDIVKHPVKVPKAYSADHYVLRVFGQSMEPAIADGSLIVVKRLPDGTAPKKTSIVVYSDGEGSTLKQLAYRAATADEEGNSMGKVPVLKSLNPAFQDARTMEGGRIEAVFVESL